MRQTVLMNQIIQTNKRCPPVPRYQRTDDNGNDRRRMYYKDGNSTMLLCKDITKNAAAVAANSIRDIFTKLGATMQGNIIITK